jgi:hypothetical protein
MSVPEPEESATPSIPPRSGRAPARALTARAGVLLAAMATMGLVVVYARLVSALLGADLVLWAPGLGLFGAGMGGALAGISRQRIAPSRLFGTAATYAGLASFFAITATIALVKLAPPVDGGLAAPARLAGVAAMVALPFVFAGAALTAVHANTRSHAARFAAVDLAGAALAIPLAVVLLRTIGAPRAALVLAILMAISGVVFALVRPRPSAPANDEGGPPRANLNLVVGFLLGSLSVFAGDLGAPWLKVTFTRGVRADRAELTIWSELGLVSVDKPSRGTAWIHTDGVGTSGSLEASSEPPKHPDQLGWAMPGGGATLVVGAGAGRDIRAALAAAEGEIFATEVDPVIVERVMRGFLREQSGDPYGQPGVRTVVSDARGYAARNAESFHTIVSSLTDTGAAGPAATLVRSESGLYTVEGMGTLLGALAPGGSVVVNRWDDEIRRLLVLSVAALRERGAQDPRQHLFACSHQRSTALLVARDPLDEAAITALRGFCKKGKFKEVIAPDRAPKDDALGALVADPAPAIAESERDISAPTDDRPFYFHGLRAGTLRALLRQPRALAAEPGVGPQAMLAGLGLAAWIFAWLAARLFGTDRRYGPRAPRGLVFFGAHGAAFALAESAIIQRLGIYVAHPSHALLVVLLVLVAAGAAGAVSVRNVTAASVAGVGARRAQALAIVVAALGAGLGPLLGACASLSTSGRALLAAAVTLPVGFLAGGLVPLAMRSLASWSPARAALASGVGGAAALFATGAGAIIALHLGFTFMLLLAAVLWLIASVVNPAPAHLRA